MKLSLPKEKLCEYVRCQLDYFIPDGYTVSQEYFMKLIDKVLIRCENCFKHILLPGYRLDNGEAMFSHLHMDQYATFLYFLGNTVWNETGDKHLCDKILNLNRILNGFFLSYKCLMPDVFILAHPVGSIIGNAVYSDGLYISQNVTINTKVDASGREMLKIGKGCVLGAGAKIIGCEPIGDRVSIGVDSLIYNKRIEDDSVCLKDETGNLVIRQRNNTFCKASLYFDIDFI